MWSVGSTSLKILTTLRTIVEGLIYEVSFLVFVKIPLLESCSYLRRLARFSTILRRCGSSLGRANSCPGLSLFINNDPHGHVVARDRTISALIPSLRQCFISLYQWRQFLHSFLFPSELVLDEQR
jgi:hypothetical protein